MKKALLTLLVAVFSLLIFSPAQSADYVGVRINAPEHAPDDQLIFNQAFAVYTDGTEVDVTEQGIWDVDDPNCADFISTTGTGIMRPSGAFSSCNVHVTFNYDRRGAGVNIYVYDPDLYYDELPPVVGDTIGTPVALKISGPDSVFQAATAKYTAMLVYADGTSKAANNTTITWGENSGITKFNKRGDLTVGKSTLDKTVTITASWKGGVLLSSSRVIRLPMSYIYVTGASVFDDCTIYPLAFICRMVKWGSVSIINSACNWVLAPFVSFASFSLGNGALKTNDVLKDSSFTFYCRYADGGYLRESARYNILVKDTYVRF